MKKLILSLLIYTSFLVGEEASFSPSLSPENKWPLSEKEQSQFMYVSAGLNILPTVSVGYRTIYGSLGSDFSLSGSVFPGSNGGYFGRFSAFVIPSIHYKQLFFIGRSKTGNSAFYLGAKTGMYWDFTSHYRVVSILDLGGLGGIQMKRKKGSDFFEIGLSPIVYSYGRAYVVPLFSISYGFMF